MKTNQTLKELDALFGNILSPKKIDRSLLLIRGILEAKTVNLWSCAEAIGRQKDVKLTAQQLHEQLLTHSQTDCYEDLLKAYFLAVFHLTKKYASGELVMDRTNWQLGKTWRNLLVIGYICEGTLIPLVWTDLGAQKSSSRDERLSLIDKLLAWWQLTGVPLPPLMLYGDREFIGARWIIALMRREIGFVIRVKRDQAFGLWRHEETISEEKYSVDYLGSRLKLIGMHLLPSLKVVIGDEAIVDFTYSDQEVEEDGKKVIKPWYLIVHKADPLRQHKDIAVGGRLRIYLDIAKLRGSKWKIST